MSLAFPSAILLSDSTVAAAGGTTPVGTTGISATQIAYGSGVNTIKGSSQFLFVESDSVKVSSAVTNGLQVYNTADQTTNYERLQISFSANVARIASLSSGTGTMRGITIATNTDNLTISSSGVAVFNHGSSSANRTMLSVANGTSTATSGTNIGFSILPTYNQSSGTAANTDLLINRTQTAVGSGAQYLIQAQVGGTDFFRVTNTGAIGIGSSISQMSSGSGVTTNGNITTTATAANVDANQNVFTGSAAAQVGTAIAYTINQTSTAGFTDLQINRTQTAAGSGTQRLIDLQVGGTTQANVNNVGVPNYFASTATPANVNAGARIVMGSAGVSLYIGTGAPSTTAVKGSMYIRTDATTTTSRLYINTDGATSWATFTTSA